ncbi:MAG: aspartate aminotransferase family protein [Gemmatimonadota bacterium]|nr:aspartate aminotransferase family protein [Gemmatimonadota bacterium]
MAVTAEAAGALLGVYKQPDFRIVKGEGAWLWDDQGRRYLDFTMGIAVNALGHGSPVVTEAVREALDSGLIHTSNLFRTGPGEELAEALVSHSFPGSVFFCNSGAEANEAAFKFARRWAGTTGGSGRHEFVAFRGAFHGRLFGTLAATDRPSYQEPFLPLMPGVRFAELEDIESVRSVVSEHTAAVIIEPIQGEGGIRSVSASFLSQLRAFCDEIGAALIFDEIQCGLGRTGHLFAFQEAGVTPDILTLAKPLGGGFPMGAVVVAPHIAETLHPGDHGTTFGGGPLVSTVALAVLRTITGPGFLETVRARTAYLDAGLQRIAGEHPQVTGVRGRGLIRGLALAGPVASVVSAARERGLLLVGAGPDVVRFLPPLNVTEEEVDIALETFLDALLSVDTSAA